MSEKRRRLSYLLRLWQAEHEGVLVWRASLQSASDRFGRPGARRGFASLTELYAFLEKEMAAINYDTEARSEALLPRSQCNGVWATLEKRGEIDPNAEKEMSMMAKNKTTAEAIRQVQQSYGAGLLAGDPDRWLENWTEDGVQMPPGVPLNVGKKMIYQSMIARFAAFTVSDLEVIGDVEIQEMGDCWAYARLNYAYKLTPKDGSPPFVYQGKALTIYQRQPDGAWKIHRDCFNSNTPDH